MPTPDTRVTINSVASEFLRYDYSLEVELGNGQMVVYDTRALVKGILLYGIVRIHARYGPDKKLCVRGTVDEFRQIFQLIEKQHQAKFSAKALAGPAKSPVPAPAPKPAAQPMPARTKPASKKHPKLNLAAVNLAASRLGIQPNSVYTAMIKTGARSLRTKQAYAQALKELSAEQPSLVETFKKLGDMYKGAPINTDKNDPRSPLG